MTILPITSELRPALLYRLDLQATPENGLHKPSQIMVDKPQTLFRQKVGAVVGHLDDKTMLGVNRALALFLGFA